LCFPDSFSLDLYRKVSKVSHPLQFSHPPLSTPNGNGKLIFSIFTPPPPPLPGFFFLSSENDFLLTLFFHTPPSTPSFHPVKLSIL
jgi:hypothetical protein